MGSIRSSTVEASEFPLEMSSISPLLLWLLLLLLSVSSVSSHGGLAYPPPWQDIEPKHWTHRTGSKWNHIGKGSLPHLARNVGMLWPSGEIWNWFSNASNVPDQKKPSLMDQYYHLEALPARACDEHGYIINDSVNFTNIIPQGEQ